MFGHFVAYNTNILLRKIKEEAADRVEPRCKALWVEGEAGPCPRPVFWHQASKAGEVPSGTFRPGEGFSLIRDLFVVVASLPVQSSVQVPFFSRTGLTIITELLTPTSEY